LYKQNKNLTECHSWWYQ